MADEILVGVGRSAERRRTGSRCGRTWPLRSARRGVHVDDHLRTTNPRIYAAGDVCMNWKFTHAADAAAKIVVQNALLPRRRKKLSKLVMPWCTYTDPEIAHVGLYEHDAKSERGIAIDTFVRSPLSEVDRAITDGRGRGLRQDPHRKGQGQDPRRHHRGRPRR